MPTQSEKNHQRILLLVFALLIAGTALVDFFFYRSESAALKNHAQQQLSAIADLKAQQITLWRKERLGHAEVVRDNALIEATLSGWLKTGLTPSQKKQIGDWLQSYVDSFDYRDALLLDAQGKALMSTARTLPIFESTRQLLELASRNDKPQLSNLQISLGTESYMELAIPLRARGEQASATQNVAGFVLFRIDPQRFLFPLIQSWPVPSESSETLLVEQRGEQVLYLNELRHQKGTALRFSMLANQPNLPSAVAVRGETTLMEGRDYRDTAVLAATRPITDTPWALVAKTDMREVLAPLDQRLAASGALSALLLLAAAGMVAYLWRLQHNAFREQRETEQAAARTIERTHDRLQKAQRIARIGSWERALGSEKLWWSEETYRLLQYPPETTQPTLDLFYARLHPDDRQRVIDTIMDSARAGREYHIAYRVVLPSGEIRHFENVSHVTRDAGGKPIAIAGTTQDVSEQRRIEERLLLAEKVFDNTPNAVMITDHDNLIVSVNEAFTLITGYAPGEVLGQDPRILASGMHDAEFYRRMWESLQRSDYWAGEILDRRKSGEIYPKWMTIKAISDRKTGRNNHYIAIFNDITERKYAEARIHHLAHHDPLTGLPNRFSLETRLVQACADGTRHNWQLAVLFIDLDRFKTINDTLGHHVGDQLLIQVAQRFKAAVRESDLVARLGGDEFVIVLADISGPGAAAQVAGKIIDSLAAPIAIGSNELHTSPSIGISLYPNDGDDADTILRHADTAMYHAKSQGRDNYQFYAEEMNRSAAERLDIEQRLRQALQRGELALHYQPQLTMASTHIAGVEALLRWTPAGGESIPPSRFIPIAEDCGLIVTLGEWVLRTACREIKSWLDQGIPPLRVAVNVSAKQLRRQDFPDVVASALAESGLDPALLEIEITESAVMEDPEEARRILERLKGMGVTLAIDDFGTGYSSLSYLKIFPIDHLKIDRSFVTDIEHDADDAAIAVSTIALAHSLGLNVIAEGVETDAQFALLRSHRCDEMQGFLFSRPLCAADTLAFLHQQSLQTGTYGNTAL